MADDTMHFIVDEGGALVARDAVTALTVALPAVPGSAKFQIQRTALVAIPASTYVVDQPGASCTIADPTNMAHQGKVLGLVTAPVLAGALATIQVLGLIPNVVGAFGANDKLFIGDGVTAATGSVVNVQPGARGDIDIWRQQVGTATTTSLVNGSLDATYRVPALGGTAIFGASGGYAAMSDLGRGFVEATPASVVAALLLILDNLPALPADPSQYPDAGGLFRNGDANGWTLTRILPKV